jgi:deoxyribodipyrimidine photo-lyase
MTSARRPRWNFALQRAVEWALKLDKPLVILEALRTDYPWASDRLHRFILDGMAYNRKAFAGKPVRYYPYVETKRGAGKGLLASLAGEACLVVTDEFPSFFLPAMVSAAARKLPVRLETVDGNGLLPLRFTDRTFPTAYVFRRLLQKTLPGHLDEFPKRDPLRGVSLRNGSVPAEILERWPPPPVATLRGEVAELPIDHSVPPVEYKGGADEGQKRLSRFLRAGLAAYADEANRPETPATSGLSPYLHFGHVSAHEVFLGVAAQEGWTKDRLSTSTAGKRAGWWGMSASAEAFLDQLVTWRELGYNFAAKRPDYAEYDSLPPWALQTLAEHQDDPRPHLYTGEEFENARTHDPLWNAAQNQLRREGHIHNYLRMLWGKKILEWSPTPREALATMIELNDKYALDGRDPNSYSGILWILGRYDRPWGPERPVFGKVRYMSSANTARKVPVKDYIRRYDGDAGVTAS